MSRYNEAGYMHYTSYLDNDQEARKDVVPRSRHTSWTSSNNEIYTTIEGETFRKLAFAFLGDERHWWIIADINDTIPLHEGAFGLSANTLVEIPPRSFLP